MKGYLVTVSLVSRSPGGGYHTGFRSETTPGRLDEAAILRQLSRHTSDLLKAAPNDHVEVSVSHSVAIIP
jgi:hypothetical protein